MNSFSNISHLDNIGHKLYPGDLVFCLTGKNAYSFQTIKALSRRKDDPFGDIPTILLESGSTIHAYNVVSLSALYVTPEDINDEKRGKYPCDALGNAILRDDWIMFLHSKETYTQAGQAIHLSPKTCLISIAKNRFGETTCRKPYSQIINTSALGRR